MKVTLNWKLIEKVIDAWQDVSDINQYRDTFETEKELIEKYKETLNRLLEEKGEEEK